MYGMFQKHILKSHAYALSNTASAIVNFTQKHKVKLKIHAGLLMLTLQITRSHCPCVVTCVSNESAVGGN